MKNIFLKITIFFTTLVILQSLVVKIFPPEPPYPVGLVSIFLKEKADVIYLGDSVLDTTFSKDQDKTPVHKLVAQKIPGYSVKEIIHPAYNSDVYAQYAKAISRSSTPPKVVIIPINIRSFFPEWYDKPRFQFELDKLYLKYLDTPAFPYIKFLVNFNFFNVNPITDAEYYNIKVYSGDTAIGTVKEFDSIMYSDKMSPDDLKKKFTYEYMQFLPPNHRFLNSLSETADIFSSKNIKALFYITPLDYQSGEIYLGTGFTQKIKGDISKIKSVLDNKNMTLLDLTFSVPKDGFGWEDQKIPNEHLNQKGRQILTDAIAKSVNQMLQK